MNNLEYSKTLTKDAREDLYDSIIKSSRFSYLHPHSDFADWLMEEHQVPVHLTPDETRAVRLAVKIGLCYIKIYDKQVVVCMEAQGLYLRVSRVPALACLDVDEQGYVAEWIKEYPIDLREVLKNDRT